MAFRLLMVGAKLSWFQSKSLFVGLVILSVISNGFLAHGIYRNVTSGSVIIVNFDVGVDPGSALMFQRALDQAASGSASAVLIQMNTPGGLLSDMTAIVSSIGNANATGLKVYAWVPPNALAASAGSYIAMACNKILMGDGSAIGPSTPEVVGGTSLEQNHTQAAMLKLMVGLAEKWGRNTTTASRMVQLDEAYSVGEALRYHLIDGHANSLSDVMSQLGLNGLDQVIVGESLYEQFISALSNPILDGVLILVGVIAIVLDLQHGSIALTIVGAVSILAGLVGAEVIKASILGFFILALSALLIILELKLGHGFAVMAGVILGAAGIFFLANGITYSPSPFNPITEIIIVAVIALGILLGIYFRWILGPIRQKRKMTGPESLVGQSGVTVTDLSPTGEVRIQGILWGAEAISGSIGKSRRIIVKGVKGISLVVDEESGSAKS